ncbi:hypothetical protein P7E02_05190 [Enterococcus hulanensis]|uniref:hypothetical protein n=1 Tax=Enterococcus hulanensis TaxID=2559929 RepID=UPI00288F7B04|nr:hypothetical protein [Enterococcus hulanensis]MDT2659251.1 hypothetical protein [Enterococcus hulanensis]
MNKFFNIEDLYKEKTDKGILPREQSNNEAHIKMANDLKTHLKKSEEELICNLETNQIEYQKNYLNTNGITFTEEEASFLRVKLYKEWFYKSNYYNKLKLQSDNCCYCFIGPVDELDHFFNKDDNPELSVCNVNLVPTCDKCNKKKPQVVTYLHPYYEEDISKIDWLQCAFDWKGFEGQPIPIFNIVKPTSMSDAMFKKLESQLPRNDIIKKMTKESSDYISSHWKSWKHQAKTTHKEDFKWAIQLDYEGCRDNYGINTWEYKIHQNLYENFDIFFKSLKKREFDVLTN